MAKSKKLKPFLFYVHAGGKAIKKATKEEIEFIFNLYKEDLKCDKPKLYWNYPSHPKRLAKLWQSAPRAAIPAPPVSKQKVLDDYFVQFDVGKAAKFADWKKRNKGYNRKNISLKLPGQGEVITYNIEAGSQQHDAELEEEFKDGRSPDWKKSASLAFDLPDQDKMDDQDDDKDDDKDSSEENTSDSADKNNGVQLENKNANEKDNASAKKVSIGTIHIINDQQTKFSNVNQSSLTVEEHKAYRKWLSAAEQWTSYVNPGDISKENAQKVVIVADTLAKLLVYGGLDQLYDDSIRAAFAKLYPKTPITAIDSKVTELCTNALNWLKKKKFMDNTGDRTGDYDPDISNLLGLQLNRKRQNLSIVPSFLPPSKRRKIGFSRISQSPLNGNNSLPNRFSSFGQQQESEQHQSHQKPKNLSELFDTGLNVNNMGQLKELLQNPHIQSETMHLLQQANPAYVNSANLSGFGNPTSSPPVQIGVQHNGDALAQLQNQFAASMADLKKYVKDQLESPALRANPNHKEINYSFDGPVRGLRRKTVDCNKMLATVKRVREVTIGESISTELREIVRRMNTVSNRELCLHLQGTYCFTHCGRCLGAPRYPYLALFFVFCVNINWFSIKDSFYSYK